MLNIEIIHNPDSKVLGTIQAVIDFANKGEVDAVVKSIKEQHQSVMESVRKHKEAETPLPEEPKTK